MFGIVINQERLKTNFVVVDEENQPEDYTLQEGEQIITKDWNIGNSMLKPKWTGSDWIESATQEELIMWNEKTNPTQKPSSTDMIIAKLMKLNAEQQTINSELMKEIAELKGGK